MTDWGSLGTSHRRRDAAAASVAQRRGEFDDARFRSALGRWSGIVAAIHRTVAAYNDGIGRERLVVTEIARPHASAIIDATGGILPALVVTLDEGEIRVDCRAAAPDHGRIRRWVALTRSDSDTAAYVLQEWMERL
jgi:hypothetical protein